MVNEDRVRHSIIRLTAAKIRAKPGQAKLFEFVDRLLTRSTSPLPNLFQRHACSIQCRYLCSAATVELFVLAVPGAKRHAVNGLQDRGADAIRSRPQLLKIDFFAPIEISRQQCGSNSAAGRIATPKVGKIDWAARLVRFTLLIKPLPQSQQVLPPVERTVDEMGISQTWPAGQLIEIGKVTGADSNNFDREPGECRQQSHRAEPISVPNPSSCNAA